jgi:integrase
MTKLDMDKIARRLWAERRGGVPAKTIQELARHTTLAVTMRYMHLSPSALDDGIEMLAKSREAGGTVVAGPGSKRGSA